MMRTSAMIEDAVRYAPDADGDCARPIGIILGTVLELVREIRAESLSNTKTSHTSPVHRRSAPRS